jgi:intracellular septation protein A
MKTHAAPSLGPVLKRLGLDILSGWLFLAIFLATNNIFVATAVGLAAGVIQTIWMLARRQKIDPMQWMAMALVVGLGGATILTRNPTFVVFKPSIFEACIAAMMLRPGWLIRYAPPQTVDLIPRGLMVFWGYLWAAAWFAMAASNLVIDRVYGLKAWAIWTNVSPMLLAPVLMGLGLLVFPPIVRRAARERGIVLTSAPRGA